MTSERPRGGPDVSGPTPPGRQVSSQRLPEAEARGRAERRPWWLLLLPASFLLHLVEEWWAGEGFSAWTARVFDPPIGSERFLLINGIAWPIFALATIAGILRPKLAWLPTALATLVTVNAGLHLLGTVATVAYSPGLVSGLLLYLPIGIAALSHGRRVLPSSSFRLGVVTGLLVHALVLVIALS